MNKRGFVPCLFLMLFLVSTLHTLNITNARAASFAGPKTLVLYDAASGAIPSGPLMDFTDFPPGAASLTYSDGVTVIDTSPSGMETFAGWISGETITPGFPILDRFTGFQVNFTLQVVSESHASDNRSGFSVIILDKDAQGIELSFWENEIWVQNDDRTGRLFSQGEGVPFATTMLTEYQASIVSDTYTLTANSQPILSGPVRDYSKFDGFPDPYETPNFLFWGDDSTSAQSQIRLRFVSVAGTEPVLPTFTETSTGTSSPFPTAPFTPLPSVTPVPPSTPTSSGKVFQICSSGWAFLAAAVGSVMVSNRIRRHYKKQS